MHHCGSFTVKNNNQQLERRPLAVISSMMSQQRWPCEAFSVGFLLLGKLQAQRRPHAGSLWFLLMCGKLPGPNYTTGDFAATLDTTAIFGQAVCPSALCSECLFVIRMILRKLNI